MSGGGGRFSPRGRRTRRVLAALLVAAAGSAAAMGTTLGPRPKIAIIIDDIGYQQESGRRAALLPGPLTYAVLPYTPFGKRLASLLHHLHREVIVHLPMEPLGAAHPGPGALVTSMERADVERSVERALDAVPYAQGLSNHMGSRATADPRLMGLLMQTLAHRSRPFLFIDSRTTPESVAGAAAARYGVPHLTRDVFLDNVRDVDAIRAQLGRLIAAARRKGRALGIGHPYPETLDVLSDALPEARTHGVTLVPVSDLLAPSPPGLVRTSTPAAYP